MKVFHAGLPGHDRSRSIFVRYDDDDASDGAESTHSTRRASWGHLPSFADYSNALVDGNLEAYHAAKRAAMLQRNDQEPSESQADFDEFPGDDDFARIAPPRAFFSPRDSSVLI